MIFESLINIPLHVKYILRDKVNSYRDILPVKNFVLNELLNFNRCKNFLIIYCIF